MVTVDVLEWAELEDALGAGTRPKARPANRRGLFWRLMSFMVAGVVW
jgi:hypothetical protein